MILQSAKKVFSEIGFENCTIRDIVRESGLSPGTFYNNFKDKETIFKLLTENLMHEVRVKTGEVKKRSKTAHSFIKEAYKAYLEVFTKDPYLLKVVERNQVMFRTSVLEGNQLRGLLYELESSLKWAVKKKLIPPVDVELVSLSMAGAGFEMLAKLSRSSNLNVEKLAEFLATLFLGGINKLSKNTSLR
ncbi:MAG: TetR/AcrR family transcriptional regulator [Leptospiraceae bacterium]|nr:TetR/AcrR family transcriptional regulator [Leptospiraceae bacterium]